MAHKRLAGYTLKTRRRAPSFSGKGVAMKPKAFVLVVVSLLLPLAAYGGKI
jgi:hypothetical protein